MPSESIKTLGDNDLKFSYYSISLKLSDTWPPATTDFNFLHKQEFILIEKSRAASVIHSFRQIVLPDMPTYDEIL